MRFCIWFRGRCQGVKFYLLAVSIVAFFVLGAQSAGNAEEGEGPHPGSCEDLLALVDKEHYLPPLYVPPDMVYLSSYGLPYWGWDMLLREEAAKQLSLLVAAAWSEGHELTVASAYRSFYDQVFAYSYYSAAYGREADRISAPPGHSEHQLGTTVDFTNAEVGYEILQDFGETSASHWLREHAADYGFVMSYPKDGEEETGYIWEPWHYRYVGVENARDIEESEGSPTAFIREKGVRPGCG